MKEDEFYQAAFSREEKIIEKENIKILKDSKVLVFGAGGVGGYLLEALARAGVGNITVVDGDVFHISNLNRQILATNDTIEKNKVDVFLERGMEINPFLKISAINEFYAAENKDIVEFSDYDYICDAIDMVSAKIEIIKEAEKNNKSVISAMGTGNRIEAMEFVVDYLGKTEYCPLAKAVRQKTKKEIGYLPKVKVVYSKKPPKIRSNPPGSISYVPGVAGLIMAGEVIKDLIYNKED